MEQQEKIIKLFPKQFDALNFETQFGVVVSGVQSGKGLWEEEPILTPTGYLPIKNIKVGDFTFDRNGNLTKITDVFIRGEQDCYKVSFTDGKEIIVDGDHLWVVIDNHLRKERIISTKELLTKYKFYWDKQKGIKARIPSVKPIKFYVKNLIIDPYVLGVLLGDGCFRAGSVAFSTSDEEILLEMKSRLKEYEIKKRNNYDYAIIEKKRRINKLGYPINNLKEQIKKIGLWGKKSNTKFIPNDYLYSSIIQRLDILRGLMDTDGYVKKNKEITFYSTSEKLADGVIFLVESLGGKAWKSIKKTKGLPCFQITIISKFFNPFLLKRKAELYFCHENTENKIFKTIESAGKRKSICIKVDSETETFVAKGQIVSHNTFLGTYWAGKKITEFPQGTGIIIAPTYNILRQATLKKFFDVFPDFRGCYKEHKGEIHLPTGGIIYVRSADKPLGIEGITANWIWLDEGGMTSILTWTVCRSRVSMTGGQILITTTPYNMGWLYKDFYIPWKEQNDKSFSFYSWASIESPYFNKDFYEAEKRRLRPEEFSRRYMGEFKKMTGLVYDLPEEQIVGLLDLNIKTETRIIGVDWGFRNPAAIVVLYLRDNCWYVVDEWKQAERTTAEIIQVIKNKLSEHHATAIYPDPAEPDRIEECRRANLPVMETNKDIKGGISFIQQLIREKRFFITNNCKETIDELSMYHYAEPQEDKPEKDEPVKFNDHTADSFRYAIYSFTPITQYSFQQSQPIKPYYSDKDINF